jgi:hypothetical protein
MVLGLLFVVLPPTQWRKHPLRVVQVWTLDDLLRSSGSPDGLARQLRLVDASAWLSVANASCPESLACHDSDHAIADHGLRMGD